MESMREQWAGTSLAPLEEEPSSEDMEKLPLISNGTNDILNASVESLPATHTGTHNDRRSTVVPLMAVLHQGRAAMGRRAQSSSCIGGSRNRKVDLIALKDCSIIGISGDVTANRKDTKQDALQIQSWDPSKCVNVFCLSCVEHGKQSRIELGDVVSIRTKKKRVELERKNGSSLWLYDVEPDRASTIRDAISGFQAYSQEMLKLRRNNPADNSTDCKPTSETIPQSGPLSTLQASSHSPQSSDHDDAAPTVPPTGASASSSPQIDAPRLSTTQHQDHDGASVHSRYTDESDERIDYPALRVGPTAQNEPADLGFERAPSSRVEAMTVDGLQADAELVWQSSEHASKAVPPTSSLLQLEQSIGAGRQWRSIKADPVAARLENAVTHSSQNTTTTTSFGFSDLQIKEVIEVATRLQHEPLHQINPVTPSPSRPLAPRRRASRRESGAGAELGSPDMQQALEEFDKYMDETKSENAPPALIYGLMRERGHGALVPQNHVVLM